MDDEDLLIQWFYSEDFIEPSDAALVSSLERSYFRFLSKVFDSDIDKYYFCFRKCVEKDLLQQFNELLKLPYSKSYHAILYILLTFGDDLFYFKVIDQIFDKVNENVKRGSLTSLIITEGDGLRVKDFLYRGVQPLEDILPKFGLRISKESIPRKVLYTHILQISPGFEHLETILDVVIAVERSVPGFTDRFLGRKINFRILSGNIKYNYAKEIALFKKRSNLARYYGRKWYYFWIERSMDPTRNGVLFRKWEAEIPKLGYVRHFT
jgi:hypothetical protein